jgi:putative transcriptional regulator
MIQGHLWEIMAKQKIRLKDSAAQADISEKTLIELKYERSKNVALETINKLCAVLNCTTNDLLEYIPDTPVVSSS